MRWIPWTVLFIWQRWVAQGVVDGRDAHMGDPRRDLKRDLRRLDYVLEKFGITLRQRALQGHGLRHEVLNDAYEDITGVPSPVGVAEPVSPELDRAARLAVSQLAGHARARAACAVGEPAHRVTHPRRQMKTLWPPPLTTPPTRRPARLSHAAGSLDYAWAQHFSRQAFSMAGKPLAS